MVGLVEHAGAEVADLHPGDRVGIGYQQEACFECSFCTQGIEQLCAHQKVIAVDRSGILRARLPAGSRVAVLGAGGLGHLANQFLHKAGHRVTVFSHSPRKSGLIERLGGAMADSSDPRTLPTYQAAFDFILSTLNVPFDLDSLVRMLTPQGQLCLVASPWSRSR